MANYTEFINELSAKTGLNKQVLAVWVSMERGVNNNILGIRSAAGPLMTFPSQTAAADATARLLQSSGNYAGIRASEAGTPAQQALAIVKSPWHLGGAGLAKAGGVDPYYLKGFVSAGFLTSSASVPSGGASTPITQLPATTGAANILAKVQGEFAAIGIDSNPSHVLTQAEALKFITTYEGISGDIANSTALAWKGKTVNDIANLSITNTTTNVNAISDLQNSLPNLDIQSAVVLMGVILVGITFLILGGIIILKKPKGASA